MYDNVLRKANEWAARSCPKWNKRRWSRRFYRWKYQKLVDWYIRESGEYLKQQSLSLNGDHSADTYPWPYSDPGFAAWAEDDSPDSYTLILDQSDCVVKHATSYCAWKIFELTGRWPRKRTSERLDAQHWVKFLAEAGYNRIVDSLSNHEKYVGVSPQGEVVWFEEIYGTTIFNIGVPKKCVLVSTYEDRRYVTKIVDQSNYCWVQISGSPE